MKNLHLHPMNQVNHIVWPNEASIDVNLPAIRVFTDFMLHPPAVVDADACAIDVAASMCREHARFKLVIDQADTFLGVVTQDQVSDQVIMCKVAGGLGRQDVRVRDCMTPKRQLRTLTYQELEGARLSDVIYALQTEGQPLCLVVDNDGNRVRGVIAASELSRRINMPLALQRRSTFMEIYNAVQHPDLALM